MQPEISTTCYTTPADIYNNIFKENPCKRIIVLISTFQVVFILSNGMTYLYSITTPETVIELMTVFAKEFQRIKVEQTFFLYKII